MKDAKTFDSSLYSVPSYAAFIAGNLNKSDKYTMSNEGPIVLHSNLVTALCLLPFDTVENESSILNCI